MSCDMYGLVWASCVVSQRIHPVAKMAATPLDLRPHSDKFLIEYLIAKMEGICTSFFAFFGGMWSNDSTCLCQKYSLRATFSILLGKKNKLSLSLSQLYKSFIY